MSAALKDSDESEAPLDNSRYARTYGHVPDVSFGAAFDSRRKLMRAGVHGLYRAGIHGSKDGGAYSICMTGGYPDDEDLGDTIIYVGCGGQDKNGKQTEDQTLDDPGNMALLVSYNTRKPVRVIRGEKVPSIYAPFSGYRYDGLYVVDSFDMKEGKEGFRMCFFELSRIIEEGDGPLPLRRRSSGWW